MRINKRAWKRKAWSSFQGWPPGKRWVKLHKKIHRRLIENLQLWFKDAKIMDIKSPVFIGSACRKFCPSKDVMPACEYTWKQIGVVKNEKSEN